MGARPDGAPGAVECCGRLVRLLAFLFLVCACLVMAAMVATMDGGASLAGPSSNSAAAATKTGGSPAWRSGGTAADAFRSSERRIPKGPDPIHNRYVGS